MIRKLIIEYIEDIFIPKHNLGYSRHDLPQIEDDRQDAFFDYLKEAGVKLSKSKEKPIKLKPTQKEINRKAAQGLLDTNSKKLEKPLIVSKDGYIMDGHHRWFALVLKDGNKPVDIIKVDVDIKKLLDLANAFPMKVQKDIKNTTI